MSLFEDSLEDFTFFMRQIVDNDRGGDGTTYIPAPNPIKASAVKNDSIEARKAEKDGVKNIYTIATKKNIVLTKNDVVQRRSDNKLFLITADATDMNTPKSAALNIRVVSAQEWEFPR